MVCPHLDCALEAEQVFLPHKGKAGASQTSAFIGLYYLS